MDEAESPRGASGEALTDVAEKAGEAASLITEAFQIAGAEIEASLLSAAKSGELAFDSLARNIMNKLAKSRSMS